MDRQALVRSIGRQPVAHTAAVAAVLKFLMKTVQAPTAQ
jgi:hypothetical protein